MSGSTGTKVPFKVNPKIEERVIQYARTQQSLLMSNFSLRSVLQKVDLDYIREKDWTSDNILARQFNAIGDADKLQNVTVPIVMPQVESAANYMTEVFLTGSPIFAVNAKPDSQSVAKQIQAIMRDNERQAGWKRELIMFFRDGLKYNLHALEINWDIWNMPGITTDASFPNGAKPKTVYWKGNTIRRMDMYNTFFDPRVAPSDIYKEGEFAGYNKFYSRTKLKQYLNSQNSDIPGYIITKALESSFSGSPTNSSGYMPFGYYTPIINPNPLLDSTRITGFDWLAWSNNSKGNKEGINYGNGYIVTVLYARIIPSDLDMQVPEPNTPQVWKFIIINGDTLVKAERQSNAHGFIPILFGQPIEDGHNYQTKSFASNVSDMQAIATGLWNGFLASKRRLVGDRVLYDPMRISEKNINSTSPSAKIPVRPSAMGTRVADAVYQFPFHDEPTDSLVQGAKMVTDMANLVNGQNPAQQGQFVKGNKTLHEYDDVMGHGNGRNQGMAIMTEEQVFGPAKQILLLNILQFQEPGSLPDPDDNKKQVPIKPESLREEMTEFEVSDGLTPTDKLMNTNIWQTAVQVIGSSPQIASGYNVAPMFSYIMSQQDVDLTPFEKPPAQVQYEQALGAWQQAAQMAAQKGSAFNTPMPQSPAQQAATQQQAAQGAAQPATGQPQGMPQ